MMDFMDDHWADEIQAYKEGKNRLEKLLEMVETELKMKKVIARQINIQNRMDTLYLTLMMPCKISFQIAVSVDK